MKRITRFKRKITQIRSNVSRILLNNASEIILLTGLGIISYATFKINLLAGLYVVGGFTTVIGLFLALIPIKKKKGGE